MIEAAPNLRILATSREALRIRDEHVHHLEAMTYPDAVEAHSLEALLAFPAVQLFCERAIAGDSSLRIDLEAARLIADMCRRLDGMALAIELAAVRVATHGLVTTARMLGERFSLGWAGRRTATPRQQTLQSMLDWSYDLLSDSEKIVLQRLSVFVGPFSVDAALEVVADSRMNADEVAAGLDELTSKSFVVPDRSRGTATYRLLEMTRAYARQKLVARETLIAKWPKFAAKLRTSGGPTNYNYIDFAISRTNKADFVRVVECWHLPSAEGANDGRHVICADNVDLVDEAYGLMTFPNDVVCGHQAFFTQEALAGVAKCTLRNQRTLSVGEIVRTRF
jgi:hypothetical protein